MGYGDSKFGKLSVAFREVGDAAKETTNVYKTLSDIIDTIIRQFNLMCDVYPHKHSLYLAMHGKYRTRKKNRRRFIKWFKRHPEINTQTLLYETLFENQ